MVYYHEWNGIYYEKKSLNSDGKNSENRIGGLIVSVLASSAVDRGFEPRSVQAKYYKIGICSLSANHAKTGWLEIMIMCPSELTCLSSDCCFNELAL